MLRARHVNITQAQMTVRIVVGDYQEVLIAARRRAIKHAIRMMNARMREVRPVLATSREYAMLQADVFVLQQLVRELQLEIPL